jgi:hypothetical protein
MRIEYISVVIRLKYYKYAMFRVVEITEEALHMELNPVVVRHLREARAELAQQREALDRDIAQIDRMLADAQPQSERDERAAAHYRADLTRTMLSGLQPAFDAPAFRMPGLEAAMRSWAQGPVMEGFRSSLLETITSAQTDRPPAPSMKDAVVSLLGSRREPMKTQDIAKELHEEYGWAEASVRSLISKMARDGEIDGVRRGLYTLVRQHDKGLELLPVPGERIADRDGAGDDSEQDT